MPPKDPNGFSYFRFALLMATKLLAWAERVVIARRTTRCFKAGTRASHIRPIFGRYYGDLSMARAITKARHCVICQPHEHVIDVACADCGDGPLVTGQSPDLGDHPRRAGAELATPARLANPSRPALPCSRPLITDRALVCGW